LLAASALSAEAATPAEKLTLSGLTQFVEIIRDHWGIAHIYAKNENDLFFAQGYNAARDRLFELEMWRRQATGTVAEILGPKELERDIGNRLFQYRGDMNTELNWYRPHGAAWAGMARLVAPAAASPARVAGSCRRLNAPRSKSPSIFSTSASTYPPLGPKPA
jgi:acyl-homoserine lactone acylase PvdQ